jgi:hypothetical protein
MRSSAGPDSGTVRELLFASGAEQGIPAAKAKAVAERAAWAGSFDGRPVDDPEQVALVYLHTFAARTDVFSAWTPNGWRPRREHLTPGVVMAGLTRTGPSISGYMIAPPGLSHVLAFDFDTDGGFEEAMRLGLTMWRQELPAYVETSRRGAHLWCVLDAVLKAAVIRKAARALLATALLPTNDPHIEIRPGSDAVAPHGLGHALRLPIMPHPKTGKRGRMHDPRTGTAMSPRVAQMLLDVELAPAPVVAAWGDRWNPAVEVVPPSLRNPKGPSEDDGASAAELLMTLWGVLMAVPGRNTHCPAHGGEDRHPSLTVMKDDRRVICRVPGCVLNNDGHGRGTWELRTLAPGHD